MFRKNQPDPQPQQTEAGRQSPLGDVLNQLRDGGFFRQNLLHLPARVLLVYISRAKVYECSAHPSLDSLCEDVGVSSRTRVSEARKALVAAGILELEEGGGGAGNSAKYRLCKPPWAADAPGLFSRAQKLDLRKKKRSGISGKGKDYPDARAARGNAGRFAGKLDPPTERVSATDTLLGAQTVSATDTLLDPKRVSVDGPQRVSVDGPRTSNERRICSKQPDEVAAAQVEVGGEEDAAAAQTRQARRAAVVDELLKISGPPGPDGQPTRINRRRAHQLAELPHVDLRAVLAVIEGARIRKANNPIGFVIRFLQKPDDPEFTIEPSWKAIVDSRQRAAESIAIRSTVQARASIEQQRDRMILRERDEADRLELQELAAFYAADPNQVLNARLEAIRADPQRAQEARWHLRSVSALLAGDGKLLRREMVQILRTGGKTR